MPDEETGGLRARLAGLREAVEHDRAFAAALVVSVLWVVVVLLFWLLGPSGDGAVRSGAARLATLAGIVMPVVLIWLAAGTARALAGLRDEAHDLRAQLLALRGGAPRHLDEAHQRDTQALDAPSAQTSTASSSAVAQSALAGRPLPASRSPRGERPAAAATPQPRRQPETPQSSLDLGGPAGVDIPPRDLILALNFPDGPDDHDAVAALRHALSDPDTARLIRAAQDVITLLAARGLYMDDVPVPDAPVESWRRFAEGTRGPSLTGLQGNDGRHAGQAQSGTDEDPVAEALRTDEVFRDAAHHFLRHWDRLLTRTVPTLEDSVVQHLVATRSGRAFVTLARSTGIFG